MCLICLLFVKLNVWCNWLSWRLHVVGSFRSPWGYKLFGKWVHANAPHNPTTSPPPQPLHWICQGLVQGVWWLDLLIAPAATNRSSKKNLLPPVLPWDERMLLKFTINNAVWPPKHVASLTHISPLAQNCIKNKGLRYRYLDVKNQHTNYRSVSI